MSQRIISLAYAVSGKGKKTLVYFNLYLAKFTHNTRFCEFRDKQCWRAAIQKCDKGTTMMFLRYICENDKVRTFSSAHQYMRRFKQPYNRINGRYMDINDGNEVFKVQ